jgi:autotransporter translocation and assembly factor TamB
MKLQFKLRTIWKWTWRSTLALLLLLYLGRNWIVAPFAVGQAQPMIAEALGMELKIGGFGGSWLGGFRLDEVESIGEGTKTPLKSLVLRDLELDYSLWQLLRGEERWLKSVHVGEIAVGLDLDQVAPTTEEEESEPSSGLPAYLPPVSVDKITLELWQGDVHLVVPNAQLAGSILESAVLQQPGTAASPDQDAIPGPTALHFSTRQTRFERGEQKPPLFDLQLAVHYADGKLSVDRLEVDGIERVHTGWADLQNAHLGELGFDFDLSVMDGKVSARGSLKEELLSAHFEATGLQAETLNPWLDLGLRGQLEINADAQIPLQDITAGSAQLSFGAQQNGWQELELQAIDGTVTLENGWLSTDHFEATGEGLSLKADGVRLPLFEALEDWQAQGHFSLSVQSLPTWLHRVVADLPAEVDLLHNLDLDGALVSHPGGLRIELQQFELGSELGSLVSDAEVDLALAGLDFQGLAQESPLRLRATFADLDLHDLLGRLAPADTPNPLLSGALDLNFELLGPPSKPTLQASVIVRDIVPSQALPEMENQPIHGELKIAYADGKLQLLPTQLGTDLWDCALDGNYDFALDLNELVAGNIPSLDGGFKVNSNLRLQNAAWLTGAVRAQATAFGTLQAMQLEAQLTSDALAPPADLSPFLADNVELMQKLSAVQLQKLQLNLNGGLNGDQLAPFEITAQINGLDSGSGLPLDVQLNLQWIEQRLKLSQTTVKSEALQLAVNSELPLDLNQILQSPDAFELPADIPLEFNTQLSEVELSKLQAAAAPWLELPEMNGRIEVVNLQLGGNWKQPTIASKFVALGVHMPEQEGSLLPDPADFKFEIEYVDGVATVKQMRVDAPQFQLTGGGDWQGELDLAALSAGGEFLPGELRIHGEFTSPDLTWLAATGAVRRAEGSLVADWKLSGAADKPRVTANWEMTNGALRLNTATVAAMENLHFAGGFADGVLNLATAKGDLGSAPFSASGVVDLLNGSEPTLDLKLQGSDLLLFRQQGVKLRSDADLHIVGPLSQLKVQGEIELTDGRYTKPVDFFMPLLKEGSPPSAGVEGISLFSLAPPLDAMTFDIAVKPGSGFRVKTNVANGLIEPELRLVGTGEVPYLLGEVYIDQFLLSLPANNIRIERGAVRFLEENPFMPTLDIRAGYRRFGYDVTILVHGELSAPEITLSSIPPLSAEELLMLTTTGQPPTESIDAESALGTVAVYLAKDWIRRFFGSMSTEEEESMLDRLEIEFGRDASQQGAETIEGRFLLRNNNFRDNDALFLTGERDAYGDFNLGFRIRFLFP